MYSIIIANQLINNKNWFNKAIINKIYNHNKVKHKISILYNRNNNNKFHRRKINKKNNNNKFHNNKFNRQNNNN